MVLHWLVALSVLHPSGIVSLRCGPWLIRAATDDPDSPHLLAAYDHGNGPIEKDLHLVGDLPFSDADVSLSGPPITDHRL